MEDYTSIELFAGAGGLALGLERAGFKSIMLNEINKDAVDTLRYNRPEWNVIKQNVEKLDVSESKVNLISGGFPCQ